MRRKIIDWYRGKYEPLKNDRGSQVVFFGGRYKRHWTSRGAHAVVSFYLREWKWLIGFVLGAPAAIVTLKHLLN